MTEYVRRIFVCDGTAEGIFCAVYDGWLSAVHGAEVEIVFEEPDNLELFAVAEVVDTDREKAEKVFRTVRRRLGYRVYEAVRYAAASVHPGRGSAVFSLLFRALGQGRCDRHILDDLADPHVNLVAKLRYRVWREIDRFYGFVRFRETGGGVLLSEIAPDNDILLFLADHFANRFPLENWVICDTGRGKALFHPAGQECFLRTDAALPGEHQTMPGAPGEYEELWRAFCGSITIRERANPGLQRQLLPLKFRKNMTEF